MTFSDSEINLNAALFSANNIEQREHDHNRPEEKKIKEESKKKSEKPKNVQKEIIHASV